MALTQTRIESDSTEMSEPAPKPVLELALSTSDHKSLGRLWIGAGVIVSLIAFAVSAATGFEHMDLGSLELFDDEGQFVQAWSLGRVALYFGGIVPILIGLATYLTPLQVGASAIAFGRGAAAAFWTWFLATDILLLSYLINGGPAGGSKDAVLLWILAFGTMLVSICWALICIATTILGARIASLRLEHLGASTWSFLVFALLGLISLPILVGELGLAYADVSADYLGSKEARLALLSLMDGVSIAPSIYWVAIPALGMALDVIATQVGGVVRFHKIALTLIGSLAVLAFAADITSFGGRGREIAFDNAVLVTSVLGAVLPMLLLLGLGLDAIRNGKPAVNTPFLATIIGMILLFAGAAVSLIAQIEPIVHFIAEVTGEDIILNSSLELNGSAFHDGVRGLVLGSVFLMALGAVHHWSHKIWGRTLDDKLGMLTMLLGLVGTIAWGGATAASGLFEQAALPQVTVGAKDGVEILNTLGALGFAALAGSALLLALNLARTAFGGGSSIEPWRGSSLEWATSSPPPVGNFAAAPTVGSDANEIEKA